MNWDQEIYGFPNSSAQPPTPSATPTSATAPGFDPTTFQTPKSSGGHFEAQFPWGTSPLADYSSSYNQSPGTFRDSTFANFSTPSQRLAGATTDNRFFANHGESSPTFIRRSASEFPLFTKDTLGQTQPPPGRSPTQGARPGSDDAQLAGSMQTPPPTSTSALKRQNLRPRALAAKPETRHLNEQSLFEQEFRSRGENPPLRTMEGLDFHPMFVTASAPVYPPQNILWDPESNMALDPVDNNFMRPSHDRQGNISGHETSFSSPQYPYLAQNTRRSPVGLSSGPLSLTENRDRKRSSFLDTSSLSSPAEDSYEPSRVSASSLSNSELSQAVDPNLLYSTPSRPTKPNRSLSTTAPSYPGTQLRSTLPYQHQQQELRREQELERTWKRRQPSPSKGKPLSGSAARKSIVGATARPRLERSVTDGALKPSKIQRYQDRSKASYAGTDTQEESSYLPVNSQSFTTRQLDPTGRSGQPYQTRTAINFTIDSNGRALVETRPANEDLVMESTSSGSESGYSETGDARVFHSHQSSFAFAQAPSTWKTTQFRGSQSNAELPRSRSSSFRTRPPNSQDLRASRSEVEGEAETIVPESERHGDAAVALRKVLSKRHKKDQGASSGSANQPPAPDIRPKRTPSKRSKLRNNDQPPGQRAITFSSNSNISPTTVTDPEVATPSTDAGSQRAEAVRCICTFNRSWGQEMIRCVSCNKWSHVDCVGLDRKVLSPNYVCNFCLIPTGAMHVERRGAPGRQNTASGNSPLAHKSRLFR